MRKRAKITRYAVPLLLLFMVVMLTGCGEQIIVLNPKGPVGAGQRDLIVIASVLCAIILVPVLIMAAVIVWRYRERKGSTAAYKPDWSHNSKMEAIWWGIPIIVILVLGIFTVRATYALEPSKPLESEHKPLVIQATSLDWKWLFTYPEQGIATVNYLYMPEGVPVKFELTSDAPMNSFWIPQLGGQMYTMSGMAMTLHLQADEAGTYFGTAANFSGEHFADMQFEVHAVPLPEFAQWAESMKGKNTALTKEGYEELAKPGKSGQQSFSSFPEGLFDSIVTKYSVGGSAHGGHGGHGSHGSLQSGTAGTDKGQEQPGHEMNMDSDMNMDSEMKMDSDMGTQHNHAGN